MIKIHSDTIDKTMNKTNFDSKPALANSIK